MRSIYKIIIAIVILAYSNSASFSQDCFWSSQAGGIKDEYTFSIVTDFNGNSYLGGIYYSNPFYTNSGDLYCSGLNDLFLIKYDPMGNEIWSMRFGGPNETLDESFGSMVLDTLHSRLLITGSFYQKLTLPDTVLTGNGLTIFLIVMDLGKNVLWARAAGGNGENSGFGIAYDDLGNIYISGSNQDDAIFQLDTIPRGGFVAKYTEGGNLLWAKKKFNYISPSSINTEVVPSNLCFVNQKLYISGDALKETIVIDTISVTLPIGHNAVFLSSFSQDGNIEWLRIVGYPQGSEGSNISCDRIGNIYLTGTMWGSSGIFGDDTLHSNHGDCFIAKYSSNGIYHWAHGIQPSGFARGKSVSVDRENNVYFTGGFMGEGHFGPYSLISNATSMDTMDMFLAKYNEEGECIGARQYSRGSSRVTVDHTGHVLQGGTFYNTLDVGPQPLTSRGKSDVFIAKCSPITGIVQPKPESSNTLLIYANPNTGQCRVTIPEEFNHEKTLILEIYDQAGRLIQKAQLNIFGDSIELDISAQAKGMYNAILSNGKKYYSGKIIFE